MIFLSSKAWTNTAKSNIARNDLAAELEEITMDGFIF